MMVALPPGPFTSMGLCVDRAESFRTLGLKRSTYSVLGWGKSEVTESEGRKKKRGKEAMVEREGRRCMHRGAFKDIVHKERKLLIGQNGLEIPRQKRAGLAAIPENG